MDQNSHDSPSIHTYIRVEIKSKRIFLEKLQMYMAIMIYYVSQKLVHPNTWNGFKGGVPWWPPTSTDVGYWDVIFWVELKKWKTSAAEMSNFSRFAITSFHISTSAKESLSMGFRMRSTRSTSVKTWSGGISRIAWSNSACAADWYENWRFHFGLKNIFFCERQYMKILTLHISNQKQCKKSS